MAKILLIEDEPGIADTVLYALRTEGFDVLHAATGEDGFRSWETQQPDLILLDVGLPDVSGFEICRRIRAQSGLPIIFLTARGEEIDRVVGLEIGGDDYVVKPFSPRELTARVRARLRRHVVNAEAETSAQQAVVIESPPTRGFHIDESETCVRLHGEKLNLSRYELRLFVILFRKPGRIYSREQLMEMAWDEPETAFDRTVDTHIKTLRQKIRSIDSKLDPIKTHRGMGYAYDWQFDDAVTASE